jgi:hypothetical protein
MVQNGEQLLPLSRIFDLGIGRIPDGMDQFDYMNLAYDSLLTKQATHVLGYLALRYNFKDRRPASMGQRRAANDLKMTRQTFANGVEELVALGWVIKIESDDPNEPHNYELLIGTENPDQKWIDPVAKKTQLQRDQKKIPKKHQDPKFKRKYNLA